ncbi:MAG: SWIM zinc finger family protein, partial [Bacteroidota bacterium]
MSRRTLPRVIEMMHPIVSNFAFKLLRAQSEESVAYNIEQFEGTLEEIAGEPKFVVKRDFSQIKDVDENDDTFEYDHGGKVEEKERIASSIDCSCQFNRAWGLPCRHMIRVMLSVRSESCESEIARKWKTSNVETSLPRRKISGDKIGMRSKTNSLGILMSECRKLVEAA